MAFKPRPAQRKMLDYTGGLMGVSAVPGSGKTFTLSHLAADLVAGGRLRGDQQVLVVTLVNSAVGNFSSRVGQLIGERGLLPNVGYQVRTLHGLCHDIVRERPALVGLSDGFQIMDERAADLALENIVLAWVKANPHAADPYLANTLDGGARDWVKRDHWPMLVKNLTRSLIKRAKDLRLMPEDLAAAMRVYDAPLPLTEMGIAIYEDYQRALGYRGAIDFDDLVRLAYEALQVDDEFLERLRGRWPYVLEDEAQDSSRLQEEILQLLAGPQGNWVRVGDPNQSIYETFTTASPAYLQNFLERGDVEALTLPDSGRSTESVISLANRLIDWTRHEHDVEQVRHALSPPHIRPTEPDDPQPNPKDAPHEIHLIERDHNPQQEIDAIAESLQRWLPKHPDHTVAVLVPRNDRGVKLTEVLRKKGIQYVELLQSTVSTRRTAGALGNLLEALADPKSAKRLATAFRVWRRVDREDEESNARLAHISKAIRACRHVESYLWPQPERDWLDTLEYGDGEEEARMVRALLEEFRVLMRRWQAATLLPIDQLVLTLAQDLFQEPAELALCHKLALLLKRAAVNNSSWRLPELNQELKVIATNERRFLGFSDDDVGFEPDAHKGMVVVTTMHRAKGMEWDRVYLMSVNNYDFPSAMPYDQYIAERWFVRDGLNLEAEALSQLEALHRLSQGGGVAENDPQWTEGQATQKARLEYTAERLRLLYVGVTRAKRELVITWNTGRREDDKKTPALPLVALQTFWKETKKSGAK